MPLLPYPPWAEKPYMYGKFGSRNVTSHPSFYFNIPTLQVVFPYLYTEEISRFSILNLLCSNQWPGAIFYPVEAFKKTCSDLDYT